MNKLAIRSFLCASPGKVLLAFDLAQAESWVTAYLANCVAMIDALQNGDIHNTSGRVLYDLLPDATPTSEQRYLAKKFNHSFNYGTSPMMIAHMVNVESINPPYLSLSVSQARFLHEKMKLLYHEIPAWWLSIQRELSQSRQLRTPYGRRRTFYGPWGDSLFKEAYSYIPQSTVADHTIGAIQPEVGVEGGLLGIYKKLVKGNREVSILNTAHDSVIVECPEAIRDEIAGECYSLLRRPLLVNGETFTIPVDAEIGYKWGELEKIPRSKFIPEDSSGH
jgi:DNA polymerase I-like protein with 3'-5' exonuclease and polymerase domains